jgi:hypothetical protein
MLLLVLLNAVHMVESNADYLQALALKVRIRMEDGLFDGRRLLLMPLLELDMFRDPEDMVQVLTE